jgi:hypothetical protein
MNGAGKSDRPVVPEKPANKDGSCLRRRGYGEPYTGTQAETPDTAKGEPTVTPAGSNRAAERVEERGLAKGNPHQQNAPRTLRRAGALSALERIRQAARRDRTLRFTALMHHVDNPAILREAYFSLKREAAPGVIVQRATVEVLNTIYETDFLGFSYGFRPGRSQHNALDAL